MQKKWTLLIHIHSDRCSRHKTWSQLNRCDDTKSTSPPGVYESAVNQYPLRPSLVEIMNLVRKQFTPGKLVEFRLDLDHEWQSMLIHQCPPNPSLVWSSSSLLCDPNSSYHGRDLARQLKKEKRRKALSPVTSTANKWRPFWKSPMQKTIAIRNPYR